MTNRIRTIQVKIKAAWQRQVPAIIATGKELIRAKASLRHGEWGKVFEGPGAPPFGLDTAEALMSIARDLVKTGARSEFACRVEHPRRACEGETEGPGAMDTRRKGSRGYDATGSGLPSEPAAGAAESDRGSRRYIAGYRDRRSRFAALAEGSIRRAIRNVEKAGCCRIQHD